MLFPHILFKQAGITPPDVARLCEVSRVTSWRWMRGNDDGSGVGVNVFLHDRVAKVESGVQRALDSGALPDVALVSMSPKDRVSKLKTILRQNRPTK